MAQRAWRGGRRDVGAEGKGQQALTHELSDDIADMPVMVAGDFNTVPGARTIRHIEGLFQDVLWPGTGYLTGTYHKIAFPVAPRIDYIFVSDQLTVDHARVVRQSAGKETRCQRSDVGGPMSEGGGRRSTDSGSRPFSGICTEGREGNEGFLMITVLICKRGQKSIV